MTSTSSDSHPTDILQSADGSFLFVLKGAWIIEGYPLSPFDNPLLRYNKDFQAFTPHPGRMDWALKK